jgi:diguanylate cyclase (GGDEF)-like protein
MLDPSVGGVSHVITVALDITGVRRGDGEAQQDPLTGLGTRESFRATLDGALDEAGRAEEGALALLVLDLNRFRTINDVLGHRRGDLLLKAVAGRLAGGLGEADTLARLGGDEFAVLRRRLGRPEEAAELARRLSAAMAQPFSVDGQEIHSGASIGIALFPGDGRDADQLLKSAELAMYRAKASGHNTFRFFAAEMNRTARRTGLLEREFRQGLAAEQFTLHFQPQLDLGSGRIIGTEALVRWRHPRRGLIRPSEFIPLAEDTGLIAPLTVWVLRRAFRQFQAWLADGLAGLRLSVNLSPVQFRERGTELMIERILDETGLDPAYLDIELTESVVVASTEAAGASLRHLHRRGVTLSIDDFGTGYSSLVYLKSLPVHRLKIDQGFVRKLGENAFDEAIVRAIIDLAHRLNLKVLAEGVETEGQLRHLRQLECDEMQGDLFSPALPAEEFRALFLRHGERVSRSSVG